MGWTTSSPVGDRAVPRAHRSAAEWASVRADAAPGDTVPVRADTVRARSDTGRARADTVGEYHGLYETGFEVSWFHACGAPPGDDTWWVTLTNDALRQRDSLTKTLTGHPHRLFVRWRGTVGPKMPAGAGHMARGSRYMLVTQVISLRASDEKGCTSA
jgi:hypothetical protein